MWPKLENYFPMKWRNYAFKCARKYVCKYVYVLVYVLMFTVECLKLLKTCNWIFTSYVMSRCQANLVIALKSSSLSKASCWCFVTFIAPTNGTIFIREKVIEINFQWILGPDNNIYRIYTSVNQQFLRANLFTISSTEMLVFLYNQECKIGAAWLCGMVIPTQIYSRSDILPPTFNAYTGVMFNTLTQ